MAVNNIEDTATLGTPAAGDTLVITGKDTGNVTDITTALDQSGLAAGGLAAVYVTRNFTANFGSASTPFKAEVNTGASLFRYDAGAGECYYTPDGNTDICVTLRVTGRGSLHLIGSGTITNLEQCGGTIIVGESITPTNVRSAGGTMLIDGAAGSNPTTLHVGGSGEVRSLRGFTTLNLFDRGRMIIDCGADAITTINMYGGHFELVQSGTITTLNLYAGDAGRIKVGRQITITTVNVWPTVRNVRRFLDHPLLTVGTTNWQVDQGEMMYGQP